jgi:hypothetical protein
MSLQETAPPAQQQAPATQDPAAVAGKPGKGEKKAKGKKGE